MKKIFLAVLAISLLTTSLLAEQIRSFDVQANIQRDGLIIVTEKIRYDFGALSRHGIYRIIPLSRQLGDRYQNLTIKPLSVRRDNQPERFVSSQGDSKINIKIGKAETTMTGVHLFTITYQVDNALTSYDDHDEFYWNVTGNEWAMPILEASFTPILPTGVALTKKTAYTGGAGSREKNYRAGGNGSFQTSQALFPFNGLTVVYAFPPNSFPKTVFSKNDVAGSWSVWALLFGTVFSGVVVILNLLGPILIYGWYKKNHKTRLGKPFAIFELPKDPQGKRLSPAEASTTDLTKLDQNDIIGTIFDLAIRGYLKIEQVAEKNPGFLGIGGGESKEFYLQKLQPPKNDFLAGFELILMDRLFQAGERLKLKDLGKDFYTTFDAIQDSLFKGLVTKGLFKQNPTTQRDILVFIGFFCITTGLLFLVGVALIVLATRITGRTPAGDEADFKIDCLKVFLSKMSRNYAWQADQLALVEKMIPYAISLGYIEKFMEAVKTALPDFQPNWFSGNLVLYASMNTMMRSMSSDIHTSAPSSSSSGFSGGGSSGGGGGGGGGGSW